MLAEPQAPQIPLPKDWQDCVKSAVIHAISLGHSAIVYARAWAAESIDARVRLAGKNGRLHGECALLREELRIKNTRIAQIVPQRRPHCGAYERMVILELRAARGWHVETENTIKDWIRNDRDRMPTLYLASEFRLNDWCIAAGFVRNLVWDKLHNKKEPTPLNDFDLIYYDTHTVYSETDRLLELRLKALSNQPWSVKNQARMHIRNNDNPYTSTYDAMSYWVEIETAVGVKLTETGEIEIVAPFGVESLFRNTITINNKRSKPDEFYRRIKSKSWLSQWPNLKVTA